MIEESSTSDKCSNASSRADGVDKGEDQDIEIVHSDQDSGRNMKTECEGQSEIGGIMDRIKAEKVSPFAVPPLSARYQLV